MSNTNFPYFISMLRLYPHATAIIKGSNKHPLLHGSVFFYQTSAGILIQSEIMGLPTSTHACSNSFFGFHIHQGSSCTGNATDPFADAQAHFNPMNCPHPHHAGDLPPLLNNNGYAFSIVLTEHFSIEAIIGSTIIVHSMPDDFTSQPSGNSGEKIGCGIITTTR